MGLHKAAKNYYTTGWHEPTNVTELIINKKAWDSLPADLQEIVRICAQACNAESLAWSDAVNAEALEDLVTNEGVIARPLPDDILARLHEVTQDTLSSMAAADAPTRKVRDHFMAFRKQYFSWSSTGEKGFLNLRS